MAFNNIYKLVFFIICVKAFFNINYFCFICRFDLYQSSPFFPLYIFFIITYYNVWFVVGDSSVSLYLLIPQYGYLASYLIIIIITIIVVIMFGAIYSHRSLKSRDRQQVYAKFRLQKPSSPSCTLMRHASYHQN